MSCPNCTPLIITGPLVGLHYNVQEAIVHLDNMFMKEPVNLTYTIQPEVIEVREVVSETRTNRPWYKQGCGKYE